MLRSLMYDPQTRERRTGGLELLEAWQAHPEAWLWLDLDGEEEGAERALLIDTLGLDPLVVADAQRPRHPPKLEVFDDYFFLLYRGLEAESRGVDYTTLQIALFVGRRLLVTRRAGTSPSLDRAFSEAELGRLDLARGPAHAAYRISRYIADRYIPLVQDLEEHLEDLEDQMFENPRDALLEELMHLNGQLKRLRRVLTYQHALVANLLRSEAGLLTKRNRHEFTDVHEHMERLSSLVALYQELAMDLVNGYISLNSHHLNQIMKVLTIVTVVFLPLSLLAGLYGMNFEFIPELHYKYGYFVVLAVMGAIVLVLVWLFRRMRWI
jgi:magnesium transporter